jgi:hypothetical protein
MSGSLAEYCLTNFRLQAELQTVLRWSNGYDSGPVNRQRWFESSTKLSGYEGILACSVFSHHQTGQAGCLRTQALTPRWSSGYDLGLPNR